MLINPSITTIIINANDNPNGIISIEPNDEGGVPMQQVDEDTYTEVIFMVKRYEGTHGEVTVDWRVTRDRGSSLVSLDIGPVTG